MFFDALEKELDKAVGINLDGGEQIGRMAGVMSEVSDCFTQSEGTVQLHVDISWFPGNHFVLECGCQAERVVHLESGYASRQPKSDEEVFDHLLDEPGNRVLIGCKFLYLLALQ